MQYDKHDISIIIETMKLNKICFRCGANVMPRKRKAVITVTLFISICATTTIMRSRTPDAEDESNQAMTNISTGNPILQPLNNQKFFLLIFVPSSAHQRQSSLQRQAIRETWGGQPCNPSQGGNVNLDSFPWRTVFLLGRSDSDKNTAAITREAERCNDILQGDFSDGYYSVTQKVFMGLKWASSRNNAQFILKADQDVYIHVPRLINWLRKGDFPARLYGGVVKYDDRVPRAKGNSHAISRKLYSGHDYPPYVLGAFVLISSNIVPDMLKCTRIHTPLVYDDPYLGILAKEVNTTAFFIRNFHFSNAIRYSFGKLLRSYSDCQFVDILAIGDRIDYRTQHYVHKRFRKVDAMNLTLESPKCHWLALLERSVFEGRLAEFMRRPYGIYLDRNPELFRQRYFAG